MWASCTARPGMSRIFFVKLVETSFSLSHSYFFPLILTTSHTTKNTSNFNLRSGVMPVRDFLANDIKVGLGTDVAGGHSHSMLDAIKQSIVASTVVSFLPTSTNDAKQMEPLSYKEAFFLATMGGARVLGMEGVCGNFVVGKQLDCLVVDVVPEEGGPLDVYEGESSEERFSKFLFNGDDRNIACVFVDGKQVK